MDNAKAADVRVGIVDDDRLTRRSLLGILERTPGHVLAWSASSGQAALDYARDLQAQGLKTDVALVDINMPEMSGAEVCAELRRLDPSLRVVMLTSLAPQKYLADCLRAGAHGYVTKDDAPEALAHVINSALTGVGVFSESATSLMTEGLQPSSVERSSPAMPEPGAAQLLTQRELEVLFAVAESLTNSQIARRLRISEATVKAHLRAIMTKIDCVDRVGVIAWAFRNRILT